MGFKGDVVQKAIPIGPDNLVGLKKAINNCDV
jgi:hypothetical protein